MNIFTVLGTIFALLTISFASPQWGGFNGGFDGGFGNYRGGPVVYPGNFGNNGVGWGIPGRGLGGGLGLPSSFGTPQSQAIGVGGLQGGSPSSAGSSVRAKTFNSGLRGSFD